jgi:hypothetical protein
LEALLKPTALCLSLALLAAPLLLRAQTTVPYSYPTGTSPSLTPQKAAKAARTGKPAKQQPLKPFSRLALGGGISSMGVNMQAATNVNRFLNVRATGNLLNYNANNITTNGFNIDAKFNFASAGAAVDFYPFPNHGFRLSPGVLIRNQNTATGTVTALGGTSFTLNNVTYYSSSANPVSGSASIGLNATNPAFTITTGWGNMIPRRGGHWSFPFELGVAATGTPTVNMALTSGQVCANPLGTLNCVNVVGNTDINTNLQAQISKYKSDLDPLKVYPIVSFGVAYNFSIR